LAYNWVLYYFLFHKLIYTNDIMCSEHSTSCFNLAKPHCTAIHGYILQGSLICLPSNQHTYIRNPELIHLKLYMDFICNLESFDSGSLKLVNYNTTWCICGQTLDTGQQKLNPVQNLEGQCSGLIFDDKICYRSGITCTYIAIESVKFLKSFK